MPQDKKRYSRGLLVEKSLRHMQALPSSPPQSIMVPQIRLIKRHLTSEPRRPPAFPPMIPGSPPLVVPPWSAMALPFKKSRGTGAVAALAHSSPHRLINRHCQLQCKASLSNGAVFPMLQETQTLVLD